MMDWDFEYPFHSVPQIHHLLRPLKKGLAVIFFAGGVPVFWTWPNNVSGPSLTEFRLEGRETKTCQPRIS